MPSSSYKHINSVSLEAAAILEFRSIVADIKFFDSCVYLGLKTGKWQQEQIIPDILERPGYEKFKIIKYAIIWTHFYIKFKNPSLARSAVTYFTNLDPNLSCEIVSNLLAQWYYFERLYEDKKRSYTYTVVDVQGEPPAFMNFLAYDVVGSALRPFGRPKIVPFDKYRTTVQVIFPTMAEALAACIALGSWYEEKPNEFYYRVRIDAAEKEAALIKDCLKNCDDLVEAFKLDYFVLKDDSAWSHLKTICQELFVQDETSKICNENRDSLYLQGMDGFSGVTFTNSAMGIETPDQPEFLPYARAHVTGQMEFRKTPRRFYENPGQSSITQKKWGREIKRFSLPMDGRKVFTPQGSSKQQSHMQTWINKDFRKNSAKKHAQIKFPGRSENFGT